MFDSLNLTEGVPARTNSLYHRGLVTLWQSENLSLEWATTKRCLETAFFLIFPNEFGEISTDLERKCYLRSLDDNMGVEFTSWFPL